jgi:O-methyltransferase involved in polyketide biosynthesis
LSSSARISPTAHYTGYVWARNGLSHPELETVEGRVLFESLRMPMEVSRLLGRGTLESYLLARHGAIDALLERAIEDGRVSQVVEVACGLSPRGLRFARRYGERLTYVEADLPGMVERKRAALERIGSLSARHRVEQVDALSDESLAAVAAPLNPDQGLAIITEGLLGYLDGDAVRGIWRRFARTLAGFARGTYISDIHIGELQTMQVRAFRVMLSAFVRGRVHLHFGTEDEVVAALREAGFASAEVQRAADVAHDVDDPGAWLAHVLAAEMQPPSAQPSSSNSSGSDSSP